MLGMASRANPTSFKPLLIPSSSFCLKSEIPVLRSPRMSATSVTQSTTAYSPISISKPARIPTTNSAASSTSPVTSVTWVLKFPPANEPRIKNEINKAFDIFISTSQIVGKYGLSV